MNKKSLSMLLLAAVLGLGACNDIQDMNLNFGERTYTNEYKNLVDAVNNLSSNISDRFNALSDMLKKGMTDIKVSIDGNTGAINLLSQEVSSVNTNMKDGLDKINTSLFNGFTAVTNTIDATGKSIITAIDNNGNLLRLQIDATGKLLSTDITASLSTGFKTISNTIDASGKSIIAAIDNNGNLLRLQIEATGKLLSTQIISSNEDMIKFLKSSNATLAEKLDFIEAAVKVGFSDQKQVAEAINTAVLALKDEVAAGHKSNEDALKEIKVAVSDQTADLSTKFRIVQSASAAGLADEKQATDAIVTAINTLSQLVKDGNKTNADAQKEIKAAIDGQTSTFDIKLVAIKEAIDKGLTDLADKTTLINEAINALSEQVKAGNKSSEDAVKEIKSAIEAQTTSLEDKLMVINETVKKGLAKLSDKTELINASIKALKDEVESGNKKNEDALKEIQTAIASQTTELTSKVGLLTSTIEKGFAADQAALTEMKTAVTTAITDLKTQFSAGTTTLANFLEQMVGSLNAIKQASDGTKSNVEQIKSLIVDQLKDTGVVFNTDGKSFTAKLDVWNTVESAGKNSSLYKLFFDAIEATNVNVEYYCYTDVKQNLNYINVVSAPSLELVSLGATNGTGENSQVVFTIVKSYNNIPVTIQSRASLWPICCIRVNDIRGDYQVFPTGYVGNREQIVSIESNRLNRSEGAASIILQTVDTNEHKIVDHKINVVVWIWQVVPGFSPTPQPRLLWPSEITN